MGFERASALGREAVIAELEAAGLRGREGFGRPAAARWRAVGEADGPGKVVVCNAVDGDPRAPVARFVLASRPEEVLDGLLIAAHAVGAASCFVCVNEGYDEEVAALGDAIEGLKGRGHAEAGEAGRASSCEIRIVRIPTALVAGEETALIRALEGRQPIPYLRADDDVGGVHGTPTLVESAETLAAVSAALGNGAGESAADGDGRAVDGSRVVETKVITVFGDVPATHTGAVPMGITIAGAVEHLAGASPAAMDAKAVQFGGPTGRFVSGATLQTPIAHEDLARVEASMGSGSIEVFGRGRCAVLMARDATARLHEESCGKCVFCREGTRQMVDILEEISECRASAEQMDVLLEIARAMKTSSICWIGRDAADPVLSALELFADDFRSHLEDKRCPETTA